MSLKSIHDISRQIHSEWSRQIEEFLIQIGITPETASDYTLLHDRTNPLAGDILRSSDDQLVGRFSTSIREDGSDDVRIVVEGIKYS